jgi:hypothetical protein|uniref:Uncharacterized protein n=1 Tax=viral metagenome TaxID=1070528 RepID=A0A6C0DWV2_9ZZZZ
MICQPLEGINYESIILNEAVKNSVLQYNYFYKLIYSTDILVLTSIFAIFELTNIVIENDIITFNKNNNNFDIFNKLIALEEYLLKLLNSSKTKLYKFKEIYDNKSLRFVCNETSEMLENNINTINTKNKNLILKISGLWESKESIGLTFKFIIVNKYLQFY